MAAHRMFLLRLWLEEGLQCPQVPGPPFQLTVHQIFIEAHDTPGSGVGTHISSSPHPCCIHTIIMPTLQERKLRCGGTEQNLPDPTTRS